MGEAYFMGVWPGHTAGHYCRRPGGGESVWSGTPSPWADQDKTPLGEWGPMRLMGKTEAYQRHPEPEGVRYHATRDGWTLVCWWDRSGDQRGGSIAAFALEGEFGPDEAEARARRLFPLVFARMDAHLGRTEALKAMVAGALAEASVEQMKRILAFLSANKGAP